MTNQSGPAPNDPQALLSTTRDLTRRVRLAQRGAWFPLLAFAAVTFAAIPFNRYGPHPRHCISAHGLVSACIIQPTLALWYWPVALVAAYVATSWFYLHRTRQRGVGTRVQPYVAVGTVVTLLIGAWALWANSHPLFLAGTLRLQPGHAPRDLLYRIASPAAAIGLALLLLTWIERSWPLLGLTVAYLIVAVATVGIGSFSHPSPWAFLPHVLIDAGVLLIGGLVLLAATRRAQGPSTA
ncbi:MAG TPA: hypothetical protein VHT97_11770 [Acidimicrobiales bacterium]|nr:hypothetical protein [Acidimicrobiales bacterium]